MCVREGVCWGAKWSHERKWESLIPQLHNADTGSDGRTEQVDRCVVGVDLGGSGGPNLA